MVKAKVTEDTVLIILGYILVFLDFKFFNNLKFRTFVSNLIVLRYDFYCNFKRNN